MSDAADATKLRASWRQNQALTAGTQPRPPWCVDQTIQSWTQKKETRAPEKSNPPGWILSFLAGKYGGNSEVKDFAVPG
jgi:hypothetical protein